MMNERIKLLRNQSLNTKPTISIERALLLTDFYDKNEFKGKAVPLIRALAFKYMLENKDICINPYELIVGERGPKPLATSTYPEICTHSIKDLEILHSREKISFYVDMKVKEIQQEVIIPFWKGKLIRELIFNEMDEHWHLAYKAGVFTEFMEQRAPGHTVADGKIFTNGFLDFINKIECVLTSLEYNNDSQLL